MKLLAFAVRDNRVEAFMPPFFVRHAGEALRSFESACQDSTHQFAKHISDYVMYRVGEFDDASGMFAPLEPVRIVSGLEVAAASSA